MIKLGSVYKSHKGESYKVIALAKHSETKEEVVVYQSLDDEKMWCQPVSLWNKPVKGKFRFQEVDTNDFDFGKVIWQDKAGKKLEIRFISEDGYPMERKIMLYQISLKNGAVYLHAFCYLRHDKRTFRLDNIEEVFDEKGRKFSVEKLYQHRGLK